MVLPLPIPLRWSSWSSWATGMYSTLVTDFGDIQEAMMDRNLVMRGSGLCREEGSIWAVALVLKMSGVAEPPPESSE
jgi:hypothetical protein